MVHPSGIDPAIVQKVVARRGRLHAFESLEAARTALVVVDLDGATVPRDPECAKLVPSINALARAVRGAGGTVAWVLSRVVRSGPCFENLELIVGPEAAARFADDGRGPGATVWHELECQPEDVRALKSGASAFFPGKCDLHAQLSARNISTLLIGGTVTNVCCESSGRDAAELGYRVVMVSDGLAGHSWGLHEASLATFYRIFGDVRPTADLLHLLAGSV